MNTVDPTTRPYYDSPTIFGSGSEILPTRRFQLSETPMTVGMSVALQLTNITSGDFETSLEPAGCNGTTIPFLATIERLDSDDSTYRAIIVLPTDTEYCLIVHRYDQPYQFSANSASAVAVQAVIAALVQSTKNSLRVVMTATDANTLTVVYEAWDADGVLLATSGDVIFTFPTFQLFAQPAQVYVGAPDKRLADTWFNIDMYLRPLSGARGI